jgi:hypothetical protein
MYSWPLTLWPQNQQRSFTPYDVQSLPNLKLSRYWAFNIFIDPLWPDLKINKRNWFFRMYHSTKFDFCQANGSQDIEWSVYSYVQFDIWPLKIKINRGHLFLKMYQCAKFEVHHAKGSWNIECLVYSLCPVWPLTFGPQIQQWSPTLKDVPVCQVWSLSNLKVFKTLSGQHILMSSLTVFDLLT